MSSNDAGESFWKWTGRSSDVWGNIAGIALVLSFCYGIANYDELRKKIGGIQTEPKHVYANPAQASTPGPAAIAPTSAPASAPASAQKKAGRVLISPPPISLADLVREISKRNKSVYVFYDQMLPFFTNPKIPIIWTSGGLNKDINTHAQTNGVKSKIIKDHDPVIVSRNGKARILINDTILAGLRKTQLNPEEFYWDVEIGTYGNEHYSGLTNRGPIYFSARPGSECGGKEPYPSSSCYIEAGQELTRGNFSVQELCTYHRDTEDWSSIYSIRSGDAANVFMINSSYTARAFTMSTIWFLFFDDDSPSNNPCAKIEAETERHQLPADLDAHWANILSEPAYYDNRATKEYK